VITGFNGNCVEGVPHGFGQLMFRSGAMYVGDVEYGLMHGEGEIKLLGKGQFGVIEFFHDIW
jgi:hypothetical protein